MLRVDQFEDKRVLIVLPSFIFCHECKERGCPDEIIPVTHTFEGISMTIYPPSVVQGEKRPPFPEPKFKDFKLDFNSKFPGYQEKGLGFLSHNMTHKGAFLGNAILIDIHTKEEHNRIELVVDRFSNKLINLIRLLTKQYWISPFIYAIPNTNLKYFYEYDPAKLFMYYGQTKVGGFPIFTPFELLNHARFEDAIAQTLIDDFDFEEHKYLDALRNFTVDQIQNGILDLTMSAEIAKNELLEKIWTIEQVGILSQNNDYRNIGFYGNNLTHHINGDLRKSRIRRSFMDDHPTEFAFIQDLWRFRCQVGHGSSKLSDSRGNPVKIDYQYFVKLAQAVNLLRKYCLALSVV